MKYFFILDNMYPIALARFLIAEGHEAVRSSRLSTGSATDLAIWQKAETMEAIVISKDSDFESLVTAHTKARLIHDRSGNCTTSELLNRFQLHMPQILQALADGETIIEIH
jgi:predicted nuclease of predicted toxin-antitoxin system